MRRLAVGAIRLYQQLISALKPYPSCRFYPSCSEYAATAIEHHGTRRGLMLSLRRVGRCRPGGGYGIDCVPDCVKPS